jgi:hypothetical protein
MVGGEGYFLLPDDDVLNVKIGKFPRKRLDISILTQTLISLMKQTFTEGDAV